MMGRRNLALHFQPLQSLMCCVFPCRAHYEGDLERVRSGNMPPQKTKAEIMFVLLLLLDYLITEVRIKLTTATANYCVAQNAQMMHKMKGHFVLHKNSNTYLH